MTRPIPTDDLRILTAVVALALLGRGLRALARRLDRRAVCAAVYVVPSLARACEARHSQEHP